MMMMFPHLQIKKLVEGTKVELILNIVSRDTAKNQFSDYRHRGATLESLCLYDYKCTVYTKAASSIEKEKTQEEIDRCTQFEKSHPLHDRQIQQVYECISDCRVISFTGKQPVAFTEAEDAEER